MGKKEYNRSSKTKEKPRIMKNVDSEKRKKEIIIELESTIIDLGVDHLPTFGGKYEGGIHLQQISDEIAPCIYDLKEYNYKFRNFLEIGAAAGGNTYLFNQFFDFDVSIIVDDNRHKKHGMRKETLKDVNYKEFIGDSHSKEAIDYLESLQLNYDIIFIDGDHSYAGVKKDFETFKQFLNYKGFVIFHDSAANTQVKPFVDELKEEAKSFSIIDNDKHPIKLFGDYVGKEKRLGITIFQIYTIPKGRSNDGM